MTAQFEYYFALFCCHNNIHKRTFAAMTRDLEDYADLRVISLNEVYKILKGKHGIPGKSIHITYI